MTKASEKNWSRDGLPAWTYFNEELTELEKDALFRRHWQVACHVNDLPEPGDYITFDIVGERAIVMRGKDGEVRAFHNLCRHRGSRVLPKASGKCPAVMTCPFHGWSYNLDGTLRRPYRPETLPPLDPVEHGLKPIEMEIWMGFVFLRFAPGEQPSVAEMMARHEKELACYELESLVPVEDAYWRQEMELNWKAVRDVDNEGYHVPMAHPALQDLYGKDYHDGSLIDGTARTIGRFNDGPGRLWSVRHYKKVLPERPNLPEENRRAWIYVGVFPNYVFGFYPDSVIFYQEYPISAGRTVQRGAVYRYPEEDRALRLSRYLSNRIDNITTDEDTQLIEWSCEAMESQAFDGVILSDQEMGVRDYHDGFRRVLPVMELAEPPAPNTVAQVNAELSGEKAEAAE